MTVANVNDITMLNAVLEATVVTRKKPPIRRRKHLCADAGYRSRAGLETIKSHGYIPHVVDRRQEALRKRRDPKKKARRRVVAVCHSGFNRFCSYVTRNWNAASLCSTTSRRRSSRSARCRWPSTLLTDNFLGPDHAQSVLA